MLKTLLKIRIPLKLLRTHQNEEGVIVLHLNVAPDDMGRVIGKQGRIAKAIRTIMRAGAARSNLKVAVEID